MKDNFAAVFVAIAKGIEHQPQISVGRVGLSRTQPYLLEKAQDRVKNQKRDTFQNHLRLTVGQNCLVKLFGFQTKTTVNILNKS